MVMMFPRIPIMNRGDGRLVNAIVSSNCLLRQTIRQHLTNVQNLFVIQNRLPIRRSFAACLSAFGIHIQNIILGRAKKEVVRVDTITNIAFMAHVQTFWDWAEMQFITQAMNIRSAGYVVHRAVSAISISSPQPTGVGFYNTLPKPLSSRQFFWSVIDNMRVAIQTKTGVMLTAKMFRQMWLSTSIYRAYISDAGSAGRFFHTPIIAIV